jgi:hypothetical protein
MTTRNAKRENRPPRTLEAETISPGFWKRSRLAKDFITFGKSKLKKVSSYKIKGLKNEGKILKKN